MKRKILYYILIAEAILCTAHAVIPIFSLNTFAGILAFPFEQIGAGLRLLSLSGFLGNVVAILLYSAFCLSPCAVLLLRKPHKFFLEDIFILLFSLSLFFVIYQMVNPGGIAIAGGFAEGLPIAKAVLGGTVYSLLASVVILRMLRLFYSSEENKVQRYLLVLLFLINMLFVAVIFSGGVNELIRSFAVVKVNNSGNERLFGINYFFMGLRFAVDYLAYAFNISIVFGAMTLLQNVTQNQYSDDTIASAKKLSKICGVALCAVVCSNVVFNILQILFAKQLFKVNSSIQIPLFSTAFVLVCLLFTRLIKENKELKDENDSII